MTGPRIAVVGGGIGGLALALCLRQQGLDADVFEGASELREIGAGIQLGPNATRVLDHLGLTTRLDEVAVRPLSGDLRRWEDGRLLTRQPLGPDVEATFGFPYVHVHRVDLHNLLYDEVGTSSVHLGRRAVGVEPRGAGATISFADGSSASADVVIGADGIHSMVREALWGPESPRFSGSAVWRGLVPATSVTHLDLPVVSCATLGPDRHFVHYYVAAGRLVNWVAVAPTETWTLESWTAPAHLNDALEDYEGWNPTVRGLMTAVGDAPVYRWALYDRDPLPRWGEGPVTLLGDACHPMLPYMAQGAAQAIEDAAVLAGCLRHIDDGPGALARYEDLRRERTARVQAAARANETMFHLPDGPDQHARDARLAESSGPGAKHRNAWVFDYDAVSIGRAAAH